MKGPIIALLCVVAVWVLPILGYKLYARRKRRRAVVEGGNPETPKAHGCAPGTFLPVLATSGLPPSFGEGMLVFEGIECSSCKARLVCACGKTPRLSALLTHEQAAPARLLNCCAPPDWRIDAPAPPVEDDAPAFARYDADPRLN